MARKDILKYTIIPTQSGASGFNTKANPTNLDYQDNISIQIFWTGSLVGQLKVFVSNDSVNVKLGQTVTNWSLLEFGTSILIDGTQSDIIININQNPFSWIALQWIPTSGTGNITAQLTSKQVGG